MLLKLFDGQNYEHFGKMTFIILNIQLSNGHINDKSVTLHGIHIYVNHSCHKIVFKGMTPKTYLNKLFNILIVMFKDPRIIFSLDVTVVSCWPICGDF